MTQLIATWILAGKPATMLLPLMLIALVVTVAFAILRDRAATGDKAPDGQLTQQPPAKRPWEENW
jgi:hypothetical protein